MLIKKKKKKKKYSVEKDCPTLRSVLFSGEYEPLFCRFWIVWHSQVSL